MLFVALGFTYASVSFFIKLGISPILFVSNTDVEYVRLFRKLFALSSLLNFITSAIAEEIFLMISPILNLNISGLSIFLSFFSSIGFSIFTNLLFSSHADLTKTFNET